MYTPYNLRASVNTHRTAHIIPIHSMRPYPCRPAYTTTTTTATNTSHLSARRRTAVVRSRHCVAAVVYTRVIQPPIYISAELQPAAAHCPSRTPSSPATTRHLHAPRLHLGLRAVTAGFTCCCPPSPPRCVSGCLCVRRSVYATCVCACEVRRWFPCTALPSPPSLVLSSSSPLVCLLPLPSSPFPPPGLPPHPSLSSEASCLQRRKTTCKCTYMSVCLRYRYLCIGSVLDPLRTYGHHLADLRLWCLLPQQMTTLALLEHDNRPSSSAIVA
ncbi:hypothetical protein F5Y08DRAFT_69868 [Xylaria arbuscula]|nr:hypothetical protein F5Y08DRAFT_69868 [Xylaria arbuscula]